MRASALSSTTASRAASKIGRPWAFLYSATASTAAIRRSNSAASAASTVSISRRALSSASMGSTSFIFMIPEMIRNEYTITRTQKQQTPHRFCAEFFSDSTHERRKKLQREMAVALLLPSSLARCHLSLRRGRPSQYSATPKPPMGGDWHSETVTGGVCSSHILINLHSAGATHQPLNLFLL